MGIDLSRRMTNAKAVERLRAAEKQPLDAWRNKVTTPWIKVVVQALDQVLLEFPGLRQSSPVEDKGPSAQFTVQLLIDPTEEDQFPELVVMVSAEEEMKASGTPGRLERELRCILETSVLKSGSADWTAVTAGGQRWVYNNAQMLWVREKPLAP
jgi:hypothetical protein